jgi:hypothetical protein
VLSKAQRLSSAPNTSMRAMQCIYVKSLHAFICMSQCTCMGACPSGCENLACRYTFTQYFGLHVCACVSHKRQKDVFVCKYVHVWMYVCTFWFIRIPSSRVVLVNTKEAYVLISKRRNLPSSWAVMAKGTAACVASCVHKQAQRVSVHARYVHMKHMVRQRMMLAWH